MTKEQLRNMERELNASAAHPYSQVYYLFCDIDHENVFDLIFAFQIEFEDNFPNACKGGVYRLH